jgi:ParB family chromosome partitioning protein
MLLQVVRQKAPDAMREFVERIRHEGLTRDAARAVRKAPSARPKPFEYRFQPETREFTLNIKFRRTQVSRPELAQTLRALADKLEQES